MAADDAASKLIVWMSDPTVPIQERRKIAQDLLDRADVAGKTLAAITVKHEFEKGIDGLLVESADVIDADVLEDYDLTAERKEISDIRADEHRSKVEEEKEAQAEFLSSFPDAEVVHIHSDTPRDIREKRRRAWGFSEVD